MESSEGQFAKSRTIEALEMSKQFKETNKTSTVVEKSKKKVMYLVAKKIPVDLMEEGNFHAFITEFRLY
jgi:hypothetical protein